MGFFTVETRSGGARRVGVSGLRALLDAGEVSTGDELVDLDTLERRRVFEVLRVAQNRSESQRSSDILDRTKKMYAVGSDVLRMLKK